MAKWLSLGIKKVAFASGPHLSSLVCAYRCGDVGQHSNQTQIVNRQGANTNFLYPVFLSVWSAVCLSVRLSVGPPLPVSLCVRSSIRLNVRPLVCLSLSLSVGLSVYVCWSVCLHLTFCPSGHTLPDPRPHPLASTYGEVGVLCG